VLRASLSHDQLISWGWRIPFFVGSSIGAIGIWLRSLKATDNHVPLKTKANIGLDEGERDDTNPDIEKATQVDTNTQPTEKERRRCLQSRNNPFILAFGKTNLRALSVAFLLSIVFSGGIHILFGWLAVYMTKLIDNPVPNAFAVNSAALFVSGVLVKPITGILSDRLGRRPIMAVGGVCLAVSSPFLIELIGRGDAAIAFVAQTLLGIFLTMWSGPMLSWMIEAFDEDIRLSSIAIASNVAQVVVGASVSGLATLMVDQIGPVAPGYIVSCLAFAGLIGLWLAPTPKTPASSMPGYERVTCSTLPGCGRTVRRETDSQGLAIIA